MGIFGHLLFSKDQVSTKAGKVQKLELVQRVPKFEIAVPAGLDHLKTGIIANPLSDPYCNEEQNQL